MHLDGVYYNLPLKISQESMQIYHPKIQLIGFTLNWL